MRYIMLILASLLFTGCASTDYTQYTKAQENIALAKAQSEASRYKALSDIAATGDSSAKVAAVMALALGQGAGSQVAQIAAPAPNQALQWASILVPGLTQIYGIKSNANVAMRSSDNAVSTSIATTNGFLGIASKIQAPGAIYTISGNSGADSGNSTSTPTVVNQPAPVIVTQPDPVIVQPATPVVVQPSYPPVALP